MSHWGWHSFPIPDGWTPDRVPSTGTFQKGRNTGPDNSFSPATDAIRSWMRDNPHIMNLGRLRLTRRDGRVLTPGEVTGLNRSLDIWSGVQTSHYQIDGDEVNVETCVHPGLDMVAVRIESPLVERGELEVALDFAYPSMENGTWVGDFSRTTGHSTVGTRQGARRVDLVRKVDAVTYYASLMTGEGGAIRLPSSPGSSEQTHDVWTVSARGSKVLTFVCAYSAAPLPPVLPSFTETGTASAVRWETFWKSGGAIDLSGSSDPRWKELERRIVLSQYWWRRCPLAVGHLPRTASWALTPGTAGSTWRWCGGTWPTTPSGIAGKWPTRPSAVTSALFRRRGIWPRSLATRV